MKKIHLLLFALLLQLVALAQPDPYMERQERTQWFRDARFGMFIHWGVYAVAGRGEWVRSNERMTLEEYQPYVDTFNPTDYDPKKWAKVAKQAGMKYAVMTAKHHDGFCLFDSKYTDYKATNTLAKKDLIKEFVEAFRAEGIKVGLYYSLIDWQHPDYPNVGNHPMRDNEEWSKKKYDWDNYLTYMHNQVEELVTNYGKIDIMWFDYSFGEYEGEKWKGTELVNMVRKYQPGILIDNRLGGDMILENPQAYAGDFEGPEQVIPYTGVFDEKGRPVPWEACITLNNDWGYSTGNHYKEPKEVIHALVNCVSKGGNLLLNVGPDGRGNIPKKSIEILEEVGDWMALNGESIYGCGRAPFPKPEWGRFTMNEETGKLYAHITGRNIGQYYLMGMKGKIKNARQLRDGKEAFISPYWLSHENKPYIKDDDIFFNLGNPPQWTFILPDKMNTVIEFDLVK